jgi:hypothetical protein
MEEPQNLDEAKLEPRLNIPDFQGNHIVEYIPIKHKRITIKIYDHYCALRHKLGLNFYYWQIRFIYRPLDRKVKDMEFIKHVIEHHDCEPKQLMERFHFWLARQTYGREYVLIKRLDNDDFLYSKSSDDIYLQKHPYIAAYKKRWMSHKKEDPQWNTLYHGASLFEMDFLFDSFDKKVRNRVRFYKKKKKLLNKDIEKDESKSS